METKAPTGRGGGADTPRVYRQTERRFVPPKSQRKQQQQKKESKAVGIDVQFPIRAKMIGHYDVPLAVKIAPSRIPNAGDGCFADQHIPGPDFLIGFYGGPRARLLSHATFGQMIASEQQKCVPVYYLSSEPVYIWPETGPTSQHKHPTYLINHRVSPNPDSKVTNTRITFEGMVVTTRTIEAGEELYADYGLGYWVDYLIMQQAGQVSLTDGELRQIYLDGFPKKPAALVWEAVTKFYSQPGFERQASALCTADTFKLIMDYIIDTYVVVQKKPGVLDKTAVLSLPRYSFITAETTVEEIQRTLFPDTVQEISLKNAEQIKKKRATLKKYTAPSASAEQRLKAGKAASDLKHYLVRAAFELDVLVYFFTGEERFSQAWARELMLQYKWHGLPDMSLKHVYGLVHDKTNVKSMAMLMAHLTGVWTSPEQPDQFGVELVPTLRTMAPGLLIEVLQEGRPDDSGTDIVSIPLFPYNLQMDKDKDGVPGEPRVTDGSMNSNSAQSIAQQQYDKAQMAMTGFSTETKSKVLGAGLLVMQAALASRGKMAKPADLDWGDTAAVAELDLEAQQLMHTLRDSDWKVQDPLDNIPRTTALGQEVAEDVAAADAAELPIESNDVKRERIAKSTRQAAAAEAERPVPAPVKSMRPDGQFAPGEEERAKEIAAQQLESQVAYDMEEDDFEVGREKENEDKQKDREERRKHGPLTQEELDFNAYVAEEEKDQLARGERPAPRRGFSQRGTLDRIGDPVLRPPTDRLLANALSDWRFKLYRGAGGGLV